MTVLPRPASAPGQLPIPPLIGRNTLLLAATQAFVGTGTQLVPTLGGILIERLPGSPALAGLGMRLLYPSRLLIAHPIGWVMATFGRKVGLLLGLALRLLGGIGVGAGQQLRTAAADRYLPERRRRDGAPGRYRAAHGPRPRGRRRQVRRPGLDRAAPGRRSAGPGGRFPGLAVAAVLLVIGPAVLAMRLTEPRPGQYAHPLPA